LKPRQNTVSCISQVLEGGFHHIGAYGNVNPQRT